MFILMNIIVKIIHQNVKIPTAVDLELGKFKMKETSHNIGGPFQTVIFQQEHLNSQSTMSNNMCPIYLLAYGLEITQAIMFGTNPLTKIWKIQFNNQRYLKKYYPILNFFQQMVIMSRILKIFTILKEKERINLIKFYPTLGSLGQGLKLHKCLEKRKDFTNLKFMMES